MKTCNGITRQNKPCRNPVPQGKTNCGKCKGTKQPTNPNKISKVSFIPEPEATDLREANSKLHSHEIMEALTNNQNQTVALPKNTEYIHGSLFYYNDKGQLHRNPEDGPAVQFDGGVANGGSEEYVSHGRVNRDPKDGPAKTSYGGVENGGNEEYWLNDEPHRNSKDGPARIWHGGVENGGSEAYFVFGQRHRNPHEGPARRKYDKLTDEILEEYWIEDQPYVNKEEALAHWDNSQQTQK